MHPLLPTTPVKNRHGDALEERSLIAAEANFLRLPLFALHTKGLSRLDGFECRGKTTRGNETFEFEFRTARNTATLYPGPLSRAIHLAFLGMITEQGRPLTNPVSWSWRNLCARLGVQASGWELRKLQKAIEATAGLMIFSQDALYSKQSGEQLNSTRQALHLYDTVVFVNEMMPDGTTADTNYLWLSQWYLDNLNALFTAPLDHALWRSLESHSPIASRLYEFLLINFYSGAPQLRINYSRLTQFLPVKAERYFSRAQQQFAPAIDALAQLDVAVTTWHKPKQGMAQLCFERGKRLQATSKAATFSSEITTPESSIELREIHRTPETDLVAEFYRMWGSRPDQRPTAKDLHLARRLLASYGEARMKSLLPVVVDRLKRYWPGAKMFVAIEQYVAEVVSQEQQQQQSRSKIREQREKTAARVHEEERQDHDQQRLTEYWERRWEELTVGDREEITNAVLERTPALRRTEHMLHSRCLIELAKRVEKGTAANEEGNRVANGA